MCACRVRCVKLPYLPQPSHSGLRADVWGLKQPKGPSPDAPGALRGVVAALPVS